MGSRVEFFYDDWLYVWASDADAARRFFGAPENWPAEFDSIGPRGKLYRVKSEGLKVNIAI